MLALGKQIYQKNLSKTLFKSKKLFYQFIKPREHFVTIILVPIWPPGKIPPRSGRSPLKKPAHALAFWILKFFNISPCQPMGPCDVRNSAKYCKQMTESLTSTDSLCEWGWGATLGESFDYIGSSRLVYDMMTNSFPYNLTAATQGDDSATLCMTRGIIKGLAEGQCCGSGRLLSGSGLGSGS